MSTKIIMIIRRVNGSSHRHERHDIANFKKSKIEVDNTKK